LCFLSGNNQVSSKDSSRHNDELLVYRYYITIVFSWRKKSESLEGGKRQGFDSTVNFLKEPEIFKALHQGFEFPALSMYANSALSSFVDVFYIHQSWSGVTKNSSRLSSKAIKGLHKRAGNSNSWC